jgi:holo-[acyl-carrier protein] synthase
MADICGIGVDIEDISRFRERDFGQNKNFYKRIFTEGEIAYCLRKKDPYPSFAVRFCAKEAYMKASHTPIKNYRDIEVIIKSNRPVIKWKGGEHLVSLSHNKDKAVAFVVIQKELV